MRAQYPKFRIVYTGHSVIFLSNVSVLEEVCVCNYNGTITFFLIYWLNKSYNLQLTQIVNAKHTYVHVHINDHNDADIYTAMNANYIWNVCVFVQKSEGSITNVLELEHTTPPPINALFTRKCGVQQRVAKKDIKNTVTFTKLFLVVIIFHEQRWFKCLVLICNQWYEILNLLINLTRLGKTCLANILKMSLPFIPSKFW